MRGRLNTVGVVTKGHEVQIASQDVFFAQAVIQIGSNADLAQLTRNRLFNGLLALFVGVGVDKQSPVLGVLLVDRRRTLLHTTRGNIGG